MLAGCRSRWASVASSAPGMIRARCAGDAREDGERSISEQG
jgi:hypothetical protein